jgi:uncharacterized membrane protein
MDVLILGLLAVIVALSLKALYPHPNPHPIRWDGEEAARRDER